VAVVSVTVDRTGKVLSARVVRKTGDAALDRSVQSALDRVRSIGKPFPSGSNDSKRTFTLDFTPRIQG
jgi:TonB family protein